MLTVAAAILAAVYLAVAPGILADDYRERAQPAHQRIRDAVRPVYRTLTVKTFAENDRPLRRAKTPAAYSRAVEKVTRSALRDLKAPQRAVDRARRVLDDIDEEALEAPDWPGLGGRGELDAVDEIADDERRYLREARSFVKSYDRLLDYTRKATIAARRLGVTLGRGLAALPTNPGSPEAFARPVDGLAAKLERQLRPMRKMKPPRFLRPGHRGGVALWSFFIRELRAVADAARRRDLARIEASDRRIENAVKRSSTGLDISDLIARSPYARAGRGLREMERVLKREYRQLGEG